MATISKRGSRYRAEVYVGGVRKSKTLDTKAEARSWAAQMESHLGAMEKGVSTTHTLLDAMHRYADEVSIEKKGERWELVRLKMFERFAIASVKLIDLRREHFEDFIKMRSADVKPSSINRELNLLSHVLTQARRWRLMSHSPMDDLKRPKDPPPRDRRILQSEIDQILFVLGYAEDNEIRMQQQRVAVAFLFAIETAMRAGEIAGIQRKHIDAQARTILLPETKNGRKRVVPLSNEALRLIRRLEPWPAEGPVFGVSSGSISTWFKRAVGRTDIHDLTFHDTRHEATTRLAQKLEVLDLARVTGHMDIKQLLVYYNKSAADLAAQLD